MSRQQLENDIWRACDIMRRDNNCGGVMEYVEHLSWLLFLKFLDEQEAVFEQEAEYERRTYTRIIEGKYRWSEWVTCAIGKKLNEGPKVRRSSPEWSVDKLMQFVRGELIPYLASLNGSSEREVIAGIFGDRNVIVCASPYNLKDVLEIVDEIDFMNPEDIHTVSHVYESLLRRLGHENKVAGEFYTPRPVIRFMVQVIDPKIGETVYDPACGSCGFLVQAFEYMRKQEKDSRDYETLQRHTFYGNEKKPVPALLGTINMVVHGVTTPNVFRRNTLEEDIRHVSERFDVVLTNPPFGGTENDQIQSNFPVKSNATELLFLEHILKKLKPGDNSRCALVVPEGTLFRGGAFATVKRDLLNDFDLFMVMSLPPGTFAPYSDVKTALLFFRRPGPTKETLYYELPLPSEVKKFSKGKPVADSHFEMAVEDWMRWEAYLQGKAERPFEYASDIRDKWRVHYSWEAYRNNKEGKLSRPVPTVTDSKVAKLAHQLEGPRPSDPYYVWVEKAAELLARDSDLAARNPNPVVRSNNPPLDVLMEELVESSKDLTARLQRLQARIQEGKEIFR